MNESDMATSSAAIVKGQTLAFDRIRRVLIIQLGDIGDVVLTTPSIAALRQRFPDCALTIAVRPKAGELMQSCPLIDQVIPADKSSGPLSEKLLATGRLIRSLRQRKYDLAIDFRTGTRGAVLARLSGAAQRIAFYAGNETFWRNRMFTHLADIPYRPGIYVADYYHMILKAFGISETPGPLQLWVDPDRQQRMDELCHKTGFSPHAPYLVIQPFSLWSYKELPLNHYIKIIEAIDRRFGIPVVIAGGPGEEIKAARIVDGCRCKVFNLAGKTGLGEMAALLSRSRLFVGIDSAGLHIAAAVGRPTVGIFGPSAPASWAPRGEKHAVITSKLPCIPCRQKGCDDKGLSRCLKDLPVSVIMATIDPILERLLAHAAG